MSASPRSLIVAASRRTDRAIYLRRYSTRRMLVRVRRSLYTLAFCTTFFGGLGLVGYFDMQDQLAATEKERDAALVANADAMADAALLLQCEDPVAIVLPAATTSAFFDKLTTVSRSVDRARAESWTPTR